VSDVVEIVMHSTTSDSPRPLCGADDPGPLDLTRPFVIRCCYPCLGIGVDGMRADLTIGYRLDRLRDELRSKLRQMSYADRTNWKTGVVSAATASLADAASSPALYDEPRLLAALYATAAVRAAAHTAARAGARLSATYLDGLITEVELILVAMTEGIPA